MKRLRISHAAVVVALLVLILALVATAAVAQNSPTAARNEATVAKAVPPTPFLAIHPEAGFPLDPFLVTLQGGGPVAASTLAKECKGFVPAAPSVSFDTRLRYSARLKTRARSPYSVQLGRPLEKWNIKWRGIFLNESAKTVSW